MFFFSLFVTFEVSFYPSRMSQRGEELLEAFFSFKLLFYSAYKVRL